MMVGYPQRPTQAEQEGVDKRRMQWLNLINLDSHMVTWFAAPLAECIDWSGIAEGATPASLVLREWVKARLCMAAETASFLGRDTDGPGRTKDRAASFATNRAWEQLPESEPWKSRLAGVFTPINTDFGEGSHTSTRIRSMGLPGMALNVPDHIPTKRPKKKVKSKEERVKIIKAERERRTKKVNGITAQNIIQTGGDTVRQS
jgi:hypothetical protein